MLAWCRAHPMVARNALFLVFAIPLAALARRWLTAQGLESSAMMGMLAPAAAIVLGLVLARVVADRLDIPRR